MGVRGGTWPRPPARMEPFRAEPRPLSELERELRAAVSPGLSMPRWTLDELERRYIARVVRRARSLSEAARVLGMHRRSLQRKLDKLGVTRSGLAL